MGWHTVPDGARVSAGTLVSTLHCSIALSMDDVWGPSAERLCCVYPQVDDPSKYGVIILDEYGRVQQFVEKPKVSESAPFSYTV